MFGKLNEDGYRMYSPKLEQEVINRFPNTDENERYFIMMYMDLHYIHTLKELLELINRYGRLAFTHYRYGRSIVLSTLRYVHKNGICGATELSKLSEDEVRKQSITINNIMYDFDEFLDIAVKAFLEIEEVNENLSYMDLLKYKIEKYTGSVKEVDNEYRRQD